MPLIRGKQLADATLKIKSGTVAAGSFSGNPKKATVTFTTAFSDALYAPSLICVTTGNQFSPSVETKVAGSFVINMGVNSISTLTSVEWTATPHGEV